MAQYTMVALVLLSLFGLSLAGIPTSPTPCLYNAVNSKILAPLIMLPAACSTNKSYCMNAAYNYGNFQYNGVPALKPTLGEVVVFVAKYPDTAGTYHMVIMLNANVTTRMNVTVSMTGTGPANLELLDDPPTTGVNTDTWYWDSVNNNGTFIWVTQPSYTDGVIIGPITFLDNYCLKGTFTQPNNAIQYLSLMGGNSTSPTRLVTVPYTSGATFEFCQYPKTATVTNDVTCPGLSNGNATVSIVTGPPSVTYAWYNSAGTVVGTTSTVTGLAADTVYVNDTTVSSCSATRTVTIHQPTLYPPVVSTTPFTCATKGSASASSAGGSGGFTYQWLQGSTVIGTASSITNLNVGSYSVKITDSCVSVATTTFYINTTGCCGDGICQANEVCGGAAFCTSDCGACCPPGTYTASGSCVLCAPGTSSNAWGATSCPQCSANTYNAGSNSTCTPCPVNTYSAAGSGVCTNCACGTYRPSGQTLCINCADGSVPASGSATCNACAAGTYALAGASACQQCRPGTYSASGSNSCTSCPAGTYAAAGSGSCTGCPTGLTSPFESAIIDACA